MRSILSLFVSACIPALIKLLTFPLVCYYKHWSEHLNITDACSSAWRFISRLDSRSRSSIYHWRALEPLTWLWHRDSSPASWFVWTHLQYGKQLAINTDLLLPHQPLQTQAASVMTVTRRDRLWDDVLERSSTNENQHCVWNGKLWQLTAWNISQCKHWSIFFF